MQAIAHYPLQKNRFMSKDSIWFRGGLNLYEAMRNNPLRFTDPSGQISLCQAVLVLIVTYLIADPADDVLNIIVRQMEPGQEYAPRPAPRPGEPGFIGPLLPDYFAPPENSTPAQPQSHFYSP